MNMLDAYIKDSGLTQASFAARVGVRQSAISKVCNGVRRPSIDLAARIERVTGGKVPAASWAHEGSQ